MTNEKKWIADTNAIYDGIEDIINRKQLVLMSTTRFELDKHKTADNSDLRYKARKANRFIFANYDKFVHDVGEYKPEEILGQDYSNDTMDYRIIACAVKNGYGIVTGDLNLYSTAKAFGVEVETLNEEGKTNANEYTGIHKAYISNSDEESQNMYSRIYQNLGDNVFDLLTNQYLIVYDKDKPTEYNSEGQPIRFEVIDKFKWDGRKHVKLKLPEKRVYKPKNEEQECVADLLLDKDIPIKIISGGFGTGKTMSAVKLALHHVLDKGNYSKMMMIRNPIGSGEEIGFLKGDKDQKTEGFFKSIVQHLNGGEQEADVLKSRGQLIAEIPYYVKGLSIEDTFILVDEAEDLNAKLFKLIGTRLGENSVVAFTGDYNQAEDKYKSNNGMLRAIEDLKGDPLVGIVVLEEDVRSSASRVFSKMQV